MKKMFKRMKGFFNCKSMRRLVRSEQGIAAEYIILIAVIALAMIGLFAAYRDKLANSLDQFSGKLETETTNSVNYPATQQTNP